MHMGSSVKGMLRWSDTEAKRNCSWIKINGKTPTVKELREYLQGLLDAGVLIIQYGDECPNWDAKLGCQCGMKKKEGCIQ